MDSKVCRELLDKDVTPEIQESKYMKIKNSPVAPHNLNENNQLEAYRGF